MSNTQGKASHRRRFASITRYFKLYRGYLVVGSIALLLSNALLLVNPYIIKLIIDRLQTASPMDDVFMLVGLILGLAAISGIFRFVVRRTIIWMSRHLEYHLRGDLFAHLLKLSPSYYHDTRTGDVMARATNDLEAVRMMIGPGVMHILNTFLSLIFALGFMIYLSPRLTLYAFVPMIVFPYAVNKLGNLVHRKFVKIQEQFSRLTATAQENLAGVRVVKAYRQEDREAENFSRESEKFLVLNLDLARLQGILFPFVRYLAALVNLVILSVGGYEVIRGTTDLGTLVAFLTYINALFWPMFAMGWVVSLYQRGTASLDRINKILHTEPLVKDGRGPLHDEPMKGKVELVDLKFSYDKQPILDGLTLTLQPGQVLGIIGMTGSGKTTLVSLLTRMYPIDKGHVLIDGVDVNDWKLSALRGQIGFATQEPFLFSDSLSENIRFGQAEVEEERIAEVARAAALSKDIESFPYGYGTMIGERGITLSGGQKQRTAIARALAGKPSLLVLDDSTSAVDTETEDEIFENIAGGYADCTRIIISHRVSAVKEADIIIYLKDGQIAEQGNHDKLMAADGRYAKLYNSQLLEMEIQKLA